MQVILVTVVLALCSSYGYGASTTDIERLSQDISDSIAHDLANVKKGQPIVKVTKTAVEKVKPQLEALARLMPGSDPLAVAKAVVQRVAATPELAQPEQDGGLAPRARGSKTLNYLTNFLRDTVSKKSRGL